MKTIYKYTLNITDEQVIDIPQRGIIRSIQIQGSDIRMWVEVDEDCLTVDKIKLKIKCFGTGHQFDSENLVYLATVVDNSGMVWHFYQDLKP